MFEDAKVPIVIAVRFLAANDSGSTPWINRYLACGSSDLVRPDLAATMVRASTLLAERLVSELEKDRAAADALRSGSIGDSPVRYAGPVRVVLEPVRISAEGQPLAPPATVEPHLRIFLAASVPRCAARATGAFGALGTIAGGFMITATPALELGWPTYSPSVIGQRVVMATENLLADGFCCAEEGAFGLDSLVSIFDFRDYESKVRLRNSLRSLTGSKQRGGVWAGRVRDAFGVPERFPALFLQNLTYGSGRIAAGEFAVWPSLDEPLSPGEASTMATVADFVGALAWYAHVRAELISPTLLESYDPDRKYSFVGWPEEFREQQALADDEATASHAPAGDVLEVFGRERKLSFIGEPDAIVENIAFAFAAWQLESEFLVREVTEPFRARSATESSSRRALDVVMAAESDALARRRSQGFRSYFGPAGTPQGLPDGYATAVRQRDVRPALPGYATFNPQLMALAAAPSPAKEVYSLQWSGNKAAIAAASIEELRAALVDLYRRRFGGELGDANPVP